MKRIAIIGGGISGLSAAYYLEKARAAGADLQYQLFESGQQLGGCLSSDRISDCLVEAGPDSFLTEKPWATTLCRELGLGDQPVQVREVADWLRSAEDNVLSSFLRPDAGRYIQRCGVICRSQSWAVGIRPKSSLTCCSPR